VETLTPIKLRYTGNKVIDLVNAFDNQKSIHTEPIGSPSSTWRDDRRPRVIMNDNLTTRYAVHKGFCQEEGSRRAVAVLLPGSSGCTPRFPCWMQ